MIRSVSYLLMHRQTRLWFVLIISIFLDSVSSLLSSSHQLPPYRNSRRCPDAYMYACSSSSLQIATAGTVSTLLTNEEAALAFWVLAFASSHIGISAVRSSIIAGLGEVASSLELVGREDWILPAWWPGDSSGGDKLFPDADTAGRQIYRAGYTVVSFATLGCAFASYLTAASTSGASAAADAYFPYDACLATAALSFGASIASLFNASPLGLMPSFVEQGAAASDKHSAGAGDTIGGIRRDDALKFTARGLTRITRHPLILPVVPWGLATSYLAGNRPCDYILFAGLALYAVAGCWAQDLRVIREEGSVGTVFKPGESADEGGKLNDFFQKTSFIPFGAVLDGRQDIGDVVGEAPLIVFVFGTGLGWLLEEKILQLLQDLTA